MGSFSPEMQAMFERYAAKSGKSEKAIYDASLKALTTLAQIGLEKASKQQLANLIVGYIEEEIEEHHNYLGSFYDRYAADCVE